MDFINNCEIWLNAIYIQRVNTNLVKGLQQL